MTEEVDKEVPGGESFIHHLLEGKGSEEEVEKLRSWLQDEGHRSTFEQCKKLWNATSGAKVSEEELDAAARTYMGYIKASRGRKTINLWRYWGYAAGIILLLSMGYFLFQSPETGDVPDMLANLSVSPEKVVVLHKTDGEVVRLTDSTDRIQEVGGTVIRRGDEKEIVYSASAAKADEVLYNTLSVPAGKRMKIMLSDGTVVRLNGESVIRYPINFNGEERVVSLNGEAYFDVKRDENHPFVVVTRKMNVKVLGTSFNLSAYAADRGARMTLVEGSVQVDSRGEALVAVPGEEISFDTMSMKLSRRFVNTEEATAWKDGVLMLNRLTFEQLLQQLHRWYGVVFINEAEVPTGELLNGKFDGEDIHTVMKTLGTSLGIDYTIKNDTILLYN